MPWRFNTEKYRTALPYSLVVRDVWPDVNKTVIYNELLAWGIDAGSIPVHRKTGIGAVMAASQTNMPEPESIIFVAPVIMEVYPDDEAKYVALVHELAHFRQGLTGELAEKDEGEWYTRAHEQDAIRWAGRQARKMGWPEQRLTQLMRLRHHGTGRKWIQTVIKESKMGYRLHPQQETLTLLGRRPVRVRTHRRHH